MDKHYDPQKIEAAWYERWLEGNMFHAGPEDGGEPYCVMIPPPNVTGILHMGHALNNTLQDVLARWRRMQGRNVVWMPGTDHAGIATQNVVERDLRQTGQSRQSLGRDAFIEKVWEWRREYGGTITRQLKRLGASCDWQRERFTMDEGLSAAVTEVFCRLYDKGLIYRGNYIVNWCCRCHTALSDEESEHRPGRGKLYYIKYPMEDGSHLVVATTRPETMLGDVAVAVNPDDPRYAGAGRLKVRLPLIGRQLAVVRDHYVDPQFGSGVVKITPAHDVNDFEVAQRHSLEPMNVMNGDGSMNQAAGPYAGLDRYECRKKLLADLEKAGLLAETREHELSVGHCYRCDTVVEPRLSAQWFVRMKPLAGPAIQAVREGRIVFVPARWEKVYLDWMSNIRDWCISRQIWWGHRIPVYNCGACSHQWACRQFPETCPRCGGQESITQDPDVLDTWFSSWLWPFSTLGWPEKTPELQFYYPTHDLVTASEIIFFWVARMIMAGMEFMGDIPFRRVYIHGTVRDDRGRKMSKSLGNSIDPLSVIERFSADAMRFSLIMLTATGQDVLLSDEKFEIGRNFGTKIWNAARFYRLHLERHPDLDATATERVNFPRLNQESVSDEDRYILGRCERLIRTCGENLEQCRFQDYALELYDFTWRRFCDWYLEAVKPDLQEGTPEQRAKVLDIMRYLFSVILRLCHPLMPFLSEELWQILSFSRGNESIMRATWPEPPPAAELTRLGIDEATMAFAEARHEMIRSARQLRADYGLPSTRQAGYILHCARDEDASRLEADSRRLRALLNATCLEIKSQGKPERAMPGIPTALGTIYLPLSGQVDIEAEIIRLDNLRNKAARDIEGARKKLDNPSFVSRAPAEVVERQRNRVRELEEELAKTERHAAMLQAARENN